MIRVSVRIESSPRPRQEVLREPVHVYRSMDLSIALYVARLLHWEASAPDVFYAGSVETFDCSAFDECGSQTLDAVEALESAETMRSVRHNHLKTVWKRARNELTVRGRGHRIPLAR